MLICDDSKSYLAHHIAATKDQTNYLRVIFCKGSGLL